MKLLDQLGLQYLIEKFKERFDLKQDKLTAGDNITITSNTISATDTVYDDTAIQTELGKKADKTYVDNKVKTDVPENAKFTDTIVDISGKQDSLTAGDNVDITNNTISATNTITTINGKTGVISKDDIVALGILAQGTELRLGNFKFVFNEVENSLDVEVLP